MQKRTIREQLGEAIPPNSALKTTLGRRVGSMLVKLLAIVVVGYLVFMGVIFALSGMRDVP